MAPFVGDDAMQEKIYDVPAEWAKRAHIDAAKYRTMYDASINDPDALI
jgi:acetyl-CoA synthetase